MKLMDDISEGWKKPLGFGKHSGKRAHYFRNGRSLCEKYEIEGDGVYLPDGVYWQEECCQKCLKLRRSK